MTEVYCDGEKVEAWAFNPNNVLSWEDSMGNTAWLLFMPLPEGAILMGNVLSKEERAHPPSKPFVISTLRLQMARECACNLVLCTA